MLNKVQKAAYELIQSDARFIYSLIDIQNKAKYNNSNFMMMAQPYIGIFADGAEQWCRKMKIDGTPSFNKDEKEFYVSLRQSHKLYELSYEKYTKLLIENFRYSDQYFYKIRSLIEKIKGYFNVGVDYCGEEGCGNTILCFIYNPFKKVLDDKTIGPEIEKLSVVTGKIVALFLNPNFYPYDYNDKKVSVIYRDYHFYKNCPIKTDTDLGFVLFSMLCSINYVIEFIDKYFIEEIPQKFKFAYLQYYYICDFIDELNIENNTSFFINNSLKNRKFRNCLAHYGLGQFLNDDDIIDDDILKGLTKKAFGMDYFTCKKILYGYLQDLIKQIKKYIF